MAVKRTKKSKKPTRAALLKRLRGIKLLSLDVDGVQTDGGLYYTESGEQLRKFNVRDGVGIKQVMAAGVAVAIVTASKTKAIAHRGRMLGVPHVFVGVEDKCAAIAGLCDDLGIGLDAVAHIGDDLNDLPLLKTVGVSLTVADAASEVLKAVAYVTGKKGGDGAVREVCDLIVAARK